MAIAVPLNRVIYVIVLVHAIVSGYHGWSHVVAMVPVNAAQNLFIVTVVFASPLLAVALLVRGRVQSGRVIFTLSMLGSLIFGIVFHFILDTADLCTNVRGISSQMFLVSAGLLSAVEFVGFISGSILLALPYRSSFQQIAFSLTHERNQMK